MATAKLNKEKLKKMMGQKDEVSISLGKRRKTDLSSKKVAEESGAPLPKAQEPTLSESTPASSVELVEVPSAPLSSKVVEKVPTLPEDASLALRWAKFVVTKEDVDEYAKQNTDVVKRALAHSLMKVGFLSPFFFFFCVFVLLILR